VDIARHPFEASDAIGGDGAVFKAAEADTRLQAFPQHFTDQLQKVNDLMQTLRSQLQDITAFRQRRLSRKTLIVPLGGVAVAMASGVLVPLLCRRTWKLFALGMPIAGYLCLFADLIRQILAVTSGSWW
jgi:hypothetical protein